MLYRVFSSSMGIGAESVVEAVCRLAESVVVAKADRVSIDRDNPRARHGIYRGEVQIGVIQIQGWEVIKNGDVEVWILTGRDWDCNDIHSYILRPEPTEGERK